MKGGNNGAWNEDATVKNKSPDLLFVAGNCDRSKNLFAYTVYKGMVALQA